MITIVQIQSGDEAKFEDARPYVTDDGELVIIKDVEVWSARHGESVLRAEAVANFAEDEWVRFETLKPTATEPSLYHWGNGAYELTPAARRAGHTCTPGLIGSAYGCPACGIGGGRLMPKV